MSVAEKEQAVAFDGGVDDGDLVLAGEMYEQEERRRQRAEEDPLGIYHDVEIDVEVRREQERERARMRLFFRPWWLHRRWRPSMGKGLPFRRQFELRSWTVSDLRSVGWDAPWKAGRRVTIRSTSDLIGLSDERVMVKDPCGVGWVEAVPT
jgi:hypothetical protein